MLELFNMCNIKSICLKLNYRWVYSRRFKGGNKLEELYNKILKALQKEDKDLALTLSIDALDKGIVTIVELYEMILGPGLNSIIDEYEEDEELIWREHVRSGIIRSIIEAAYPSVLKESKQLDTSKGRVTVMCPDYEDHELGAKMVADFFTLEGYDSTFIGAKTPQKTILKAIDIVKPKYLCISVTNHYNLISVKRTIDMIKENIDENPLFLLGGSAFNSNPDAYKAVGGDLLLNNYNDIKNLHKEVE